MLISPTAVGMASNFRHRSRSGRSKIFDYGRRPSAYGPTLPKGQLIKKAKFSVLNYSREETIVFLLFSKYS